MNYTYDISDCFFCKKELKHGTDHEELYCKHCQLYYNYYQYGHPAQPGFCGWKLLSIETTNQFHDRNILYMLSKLNDEECVLLQKSHNGEYYQMHMFNSWGEIWSLEKIKKLWTML